MSEKRTANEIERLLAENKRLRDGLEYMFGFVKKYCVTFWTSKAAAMLLDGDTWKRMLLGKYMPDEQPGYVGELRNEIKRLKTENEKLSQTVSKDLAKGLWNELDKRGTLAQTIATLKHLLEDLVYRTAEYRYARTVLGTGSSEALSAYDAMYKAEERAEKFLRELGEREGVRNG